MQSTYFEESETGSPTNTLPREREMVATYSTLNEEQVEFQLNTRRGPVNPWRDNDLDLLTPVNIVKRTSFWIAVCLIVVFACFVTWDIYTHSQKHRNNLAHAIKPSTTTEMDIIHYDD